MLRLPTLTLLGIDSASENEPRGHVQGQGSGKVHRAAGIGVADSADIRGVGSEPAHARHAYAVHSRILPATQIHLSVLPAGLPPE